MKALLWHVCRLPCMFLGICPCSPCDRASPRDSESTLGSMTALLSRWWTRAAPPAREEHQRLSKTPSKRPKQILCVCTYKTPALLLGVVHTLCKFIRVVFAATKMLLFKPECASCQELRASPSSARSASYLSVKFKRLLAALFTPHWHRVSQSALRSQRWRHAFVQSESSPRISASARAGKHRQTKLIEHYETRSAVNGSTGRYVVIYRRAKCLCVL